MIISKLQGGLGNQMFQYSVGRSLARRLNVPLKLDTNHYSNDIKRQYYLGDFTIYSEIARSDEIKRLKNDSILNKMTGRFLGKRNGAIFKEPDRNFHAEVLNLPDNTYLDGFWQSEKYFIDIENIIRREFSLKEPLSVASNSLLELIDKSDSVSIHIRRGDYILPKYRKIFHQCSAEYYQNAISLINDKITNPHFFIFSDDSEWARAMIFPKNTTYIESCLGLKNFQELVIMSRCKYNITANSTFSWWGAWLNKNKNKIVITPKKWYIDDAFKANDLIPKNWVKL